jgi:pyridoxamine 5'-phosphate oxidase
MDIAGIRKDYRQRALLEGDAANDAIKQFDLWWQEAVNSQIEEVNAMTLATADANGKPSARIVLLKGFDENGFVFFTNYQSHKSGDLEVNPHASLVFFWKELERQVRITGTVTKVLPSESDAYFSSRPEESQLGALASNQSSVISSRKDLEARMEEVRKEWSGKEISRPAHWGGYRVIPTQIEFWQGRPGRLHDRLLYTLQQNRSWHINRLMP